MSETPKRRFLQVHNFYEQYLAEFYAENQRLASASFDEQIRALISQGFCGVHMMAPYMDRVGYDGRFIVANNPYSQAQWLNENGQRLENGSEWIFEVVRRQIEAFKPDVLYLSDPTYYDSKFVRTLSHRPEIILGWRAANIPLGTDWTEFDIMLSSLAGLREMALTLGAKAAEPFWPAFPEWIYEEIKAQQPEADLSFTGQWTLAQHADRNALVKMLAERSLRPESNFSVALFLSGQLDTLPPAVAKLNRRAVYGLDMYRALRRGRIAFDARGSIGLTGQAGGTPDLAGNQTANMRIFEATGSGAFLLTQAHDNVAEIFEPGVEIETFRDERELLAKIDHYLKNPDQRLQIAERGWQRCLRDHSMTARVRQLDQIIRKHSKREQPAPAIARTIEVTLSAKNQNEMIDRALSHLKNGQSTAALELLESVKSGERVRDFEYVRAIGLLQIGGPDNHTKAKEALMKELDMHPTNTAARELLNQVVFSS